jgi:predicted Ser/Thr protein kinase
MNESEANPNMENKCPQCGAPLPSGVLAGLCPACLFKQGAAADTAVPPETAAFQPPSVEEIAKLFPNLEIIAFIGKGGMGAVYKARQPGLDRIVALKIIPPQTAAGPGFIERFNREARALAKLSHPNIVAVHEFGQVNGLPYFIMEFVDGLNLRELERAGKLSAREALQIVPQICEALQFAHDEGIVHRDIKPENILLDKKGRVKIADFGIAKILRGGPDAAITETGGAIGTPHYMAPEQMEKPTSVDHRADIFSLGVVFYEMLTGELPLGKFAPPSSRKVEVDVRLDEVVLRALEKDPELRYQHASQVKTAVDTIAGSSTPPPVADATALANQILEQDYTLRIRSCLKRGWKLLCANFWPCVGVTALLMALLSFAGSVGGVVLRTGPAGKNSEQITSVLGLIVFGPLMGGLNLFFLKKIRGEKSTVETIFCGFSKRFLHLFLAGFVTTLLTWIGFLCLILPGIYLMVAWCFAIPLVIDKGLDFWSAMELSRKVVTRHWWKFLLFGIVLIALLFLGVLTFIVGIFLMMPWIVASQMYAYEDIIGSVKQTAAPPVMGPSGTAVLPRELPPLPSSGWRLAVKTTVAVLLAMLVVLCCVVLVIAARAHHAERRMRARQETSGAVSASVAPEPIEAPAHLVFGPVNEFDVQARSTETNQFLDLDKQQLLTPSDDIARVLPQETNAERFWEALDIPRDSRRFKYPAWLNESGADLLYVGDGKIIGFDGVFSAAHGNSSTNWDEWDDMTPEQVLTAVDGLSASNLSFQLARDAAEDRLKGKQSQPSPVRPAIVLDSSEPGGPVVNLLTRDQSVTWFFKTREGAEGVLQLVSFTKDPASAKLRYKLIQQTNGEGVTVPLQVKNTSDDTLTDRLQAALMMNDYNGKDNALGKLALDAAKAGNSKVAGDALAKMYDYTARSQAALGTIRELARHGLRKPAMEIAKTIPDFNLRDQALSELAGQ